MSARPRRNGELGIFLVGLLCLMVELLHTRMLAFFLGSISNFLAIPVSLFGLALGSLLVHRARKVDNVESQGARRLIARLREMEPEDAGYDATVMELMRDVIHHVADEETILLPDAERVLADRLEELGSAMTKRRLELVAPRTLELAWSHARALPASNVLMGAGAVALVVMLLGGMRRKSRFHLSRGMA